MKRKYVIKEQYDEYEESRCDCFFYTENQTKGDFNSDAVGSCALSGGKKFSKKNMMLSPPKWCKLRRGKVTIKQANKNVITCEVKKYKRGGGRWEHGGGGCGLGSGRYCCDDSYYHSLSGKRIVFETTMEAHFTMPDKVKSLKTLERKKGVKRWNG